MTGGRSACAPSGWGRGLQRRVVIQTARASLTRNTFPTNESHQISDDSPWASALISQAGEAMRTANANLDILFIAGFGPIVRDTAKSRKLYGDVMRIPFKEETGEYLHTEALGGAKTFALWPLPQAARSCFGKDSWPDNVPVPQAWLEFDVGSVEKATAELESKGYKMLVKNRKEPWGQVVSRFLSPEGLLIGVTFTPMMRDSEEEAS